MKNIIKAAVFAAAVILTAPAAYAEVIGEAVITDIGAFIDYLPISSYNVDGSTYVEAENLRYYGFDVLWDEQARTLSIDPNVGDMYSPMTEDEINIEKASISSGAHAFDIYKTDITTFVCGEEVPACSLDGVMLIKLRDLERCAYISFDETYRTASAEVTRYVIDREYEAAAKETIDLGGGMIYTGETVNGKPQGMGRITQSGTESIYSTSGRGSYPLYTYDHDEEYVNTYTGYFENGIPSGRFFTVTQPVIRLGSMYQHNGMEFLSTAYAVEYYSGGSLASSAVDVRIPSEEYVLGTPGRGGGYAYIGNNQYRGFRYFNRINGKESYVLTPSSDMLYGGRISESGIDDNLMRHRYRDDSVKFVSCVDIEYYSYAISENGDLYVWEYTLPTSDRTFDEPMYVRRNIAAAAEQVTSRMEFSLANYKILARDNKLYLINNTFEDSLDILLRENVAEVERDKYLTTDGSLYRFDSSGESISPTNEFDELIDTDVKCIRDKSYIKNDGSAWIIINNNDGLSAVKVADNVVDVDCYDYLYSTVYISDKGELFYCSDMLNGAGDFIKISDNTSKAKIVTGRISYTDKNNNLYYVTITDGEAGEPVFAMENVVDFSNNGILAVTSDGKLWDIRTKDGAVVRTQLFAHEQIPLISKE